MIQISIPLQSETDYVDSIGENSIQLDANEIANAVIYTPEKEGEQEFYPNLEMFVELETAPECIVNGMPVQSELVFGGLHGTHRPKPQS